MLGVLKFIRLSKSYILCIETKYQNLYASIFYTLFSFRSSFKTLVFPFQMIHRVHKGTDILSSMLISMVSLYSVHTYRSA
uniref:Putative ovule protein n=1 Tax=Solanum chacoense TaxID=4108 RepID=A0A0V0H287_SOLCH